MSETIHWRRTLKDGGVEFYFACGNEGMSGSVAPASVADDLQRLFEQLHGPLPPCEWKQPRASRGQGERA